MSKSSTIGLADLADALRLLGPGEAAVGRIAALLNFKLAPEGARQTRPDGGHAAVESDASADADGGDSRARSRTGLDAEGPHGDAPEGSDAGDLPQNSEPITFELLTPARPSRPLPRVVRDAILPPKWDAGLPPAVKPQPLIPNHLARSFIWETLARPLNVDEIDVDAAVEQLAQSRLPTLARRRRKGLRNGVQVLADESPAMQPFYEDVRDLRERIRKVAGPSWLGDLSFQSLPDPRAAGEHGDGLEGYQPPSSGTTVLLITDFGIGRPRGFRRASRRVRDAFLRRLTAAGCNVVALVPYAPHRWPRVQQEAVKLKYWGALKPRDAQTDVRDFARPLAAAATLDTALIREARLKYFPDADAGLEADLLFSRLVGVANARVVTLRDDVLRELRDELAARPPEYEKAVRFLADYREHSGAAGHLRFEEGLVAALLSGSTQEFHSFVGGMLRALIEEGDNPGMARRAVSLVNGLPPQAREHTLCQQLQSAASLRLGIAPLDFEGTLTEHDWLLPEYADVEVGWAGGSLFLRDPPATNGIRISIPATVPRHVLLKPAAGPPTQAQVWPERGDCVIHAEMPVELTDLSGARYLLRREFVPSEEPPPPAPTYPESLKPVFVSSTIRDLPAHREEVSDACLRMGMYPLMVEDLPASDRQTVEHSIRMVDEAEVFLGVIGHRYGYVPREGNPQQISITEMEYDRAVERGIPRLIYVMHENHLVAPTDVEQGEGMEKLGRLKARLTAEQSIRFFKSPADLRGYVINDLSLLREPDLIRFHHVGDITEPPEPYIAHPYTLLQTHRLVGRQPELNHLTDWVARPDAEVYKARILNIVAVGGMGKSALTWKWFNDIAPQEMQPMAGRLWWSFYESDATFENFVINALAYVTRRPLAEVQQIPAPDRETQLLAALDREPFLLVLDGLERILIAYARMDAAHLSDDDYDKQTANVVANAYGLPESAAQSFTGERRLRKTADPRAGLFLRKLSKVRAARVLVSTRLYPADLQTATGQSLGSCAAVFLRGLADDDALDLWRAFGATGARGSLLPLFQRADNHPLLIQALASEVARYRPAPGDFDAWRRAHPDFNPFDLSLVQVKSHVLAFALRGLDDKAQQVLRTIAAFRMSASYDTLTALLIGEGKACADERELDGVLTELEDRGLVGWDKRANRYDLHPLVRGVVWSGLSDDARRGVYTSLHEHFEAVPMVDDEHKVYSLEDLTPAIELYNTLIGLERYDDALTQFRERLDSATLHRLGASRQRVELLKLLFPDGPEQLPRLKRVGDQAYALGALAQGYHFSGQPVRAAALHRRANLIISEMKDDQSLNFSLTNLSYALRLSGALRESEAALRRAMTIAPEQDYPIREAMFGLTLAVRGLANESGPPLDRALRLCVAQSSGQGEGVVNSYLAQRALWFGEFAGALSFANKAWELAHTDMLETDFIRAARVQGEATLGLNDLAAADERLHHALTRARKVNLIEEELPALVALAELRRRQGDVKASRELLEDVWEAAERGPYPLVHADACNMLAQVERDAGNKGAAVEAAVRAYKLAWCDAPPFAYHWGLEKARALLKELGGQEPTLPPFDESKFEPFAEA
ncbi:MAG: DUF4062 domain-containing protein [Pyrinomonadaceae bacterium]